MWTGARSGNRLPRPSEMSRQRPIKECNDPGNEEDFGFGHHCRGSPWITLRKPSATPGFRETYIEHCAR